MLVLFFTINQSYSQFTIDQYRKEISSLESSKDFFNYWESLQAIDQEVLMNVPSGNKIQFDSISTSLMIRTLLMKDIHGAKVFKSNDLMPILNHVHNKIADLSVSFWPILKLCLQEGPYIKSIGGGYPAYQLEALSYNFYGYSLFNQDSVYSELLARIDSVSKEVSVEMLVLSYERQKQLTQLKVKETIGEWYQQAFKDKPRESCFQIVKMSDNLWYINKGNYLLKLNKIIKGEELILQIDGEPLGWYYTLGKTNELKLFNKEQINLISYSKCD